MLFVRKAPTIVVHDDPVARAESSMLAEERGRSSGAMAVLGVLAVAALLLLIGYFVWWAPGPSSPSVVHDTQVIEKPGSPPTIINQAPSSPPTIINNPPQQSNPPTIIHEHETVPVPVPTTTGGTEGGGTSGTNNGGDTSGGTSTGG